MSAAIDKLIEVDYALVRLLALPGYNPDHSTLAELHESIIRFLKFQEQNQSLAEEFSQSGTLKRFLLQRGFMPHDEKDAEAILDSIIKENEQRT